jgi:hypothetical protein
MTARLRPDGMTPKQWNASWRARRKNPNPDISFDLPSSPDPSAEELIERKLHDFKRKQEYEDQRKEILIKVNKTGPIGILHLGDPHVDDDGCDWSALLRDIEIIEKTPGMLAANIGDSTNNWVGRLAHLYGQQSSTAREAWVMAEWLFRRLSSKWLYLIAGNHDCWSGDGDPLRWITESIGALYESSEVRLKLQFPNGREVMINARHDFAGGSQYNPAHGPMKAMQFGVRDDVIICGHKHKSGYGVLKDPETGKICHCIQVASYKVFDRYAREKGFRDQNISPCCVTLIDPDATSPASLIQVFWDARAAADYLIYLRLKREVA